MFEKDVWYDIKLKNGRIYIKKETDKRYRKATKEEADYLNNKFIKGDIGEWKVSKD